MKRPFSPWIDPFRLALIGLAVAVAGCGRQTADTAPDVAAVTDLVYDLADLSRDPSRFAAQFAPSSVPTDKQRQAYGDCFFKLAEPPVIDGDSASMQVSVTCEDREAPVQWQAVRQGGSWKLTAAPLPGKRVTTSRPAAAP